MSNASFLPEDYLVQKAERRTNLICLTLFGVVMIAVFGAFLVTNRQWTKVKSDQREINEQYQQAAQQIERLTELEQQKQQVLDRADLAAALVERVLRSVLLADLINRMPTRLSLLEFELSSEKIRVMSSPGKPASTGGRLAAPVRGKTKEEAAAEVKKIEPPQYKVTLKMIGLAPTDLEVSRYMQELNGYELLDSVNLEYSKEREVEGQIMRQFKIIMSLDPDADVRTVTPLAKPRGLRNPMDDSVDLNLKNAGRTVLSPTGETSGE